MKNIIIFLCVILGTLIGAGFASGKEIYIFFAQYGVYGILGAIVSAVVTALIIYKVLKISNKLNINKNCEFVKRITVNKQISMIIENIINIFLTLSFWVMNAGICTFFFQEIKIPIIITSVINAVIIYILFMKKMKGIQSLNTVVVPVMVIIIISVSIKSFPLKEMLKLDINRNIEVAEIIKVFTRAILYSSYNSITLIPIVILMSKSIKENKKISSILIGIMIFILIFSIFKILLLSPVRIANDEFPILTILKNCTKMEQILYKIAIIVAIFTSQISAGFAVLENAKNNRQYSILAIIMCILSIPISYVGFGKLISIFYPTFGIIGIIQIILITCFKENENKS